LVVVVTVFGRSGSVQVLGGVSLVALSLGGLLVAYQLTGLQFPEWVYFGLLGLGTIGGPTLNGYRDGGVVVSCLAAAIGVAPMALAFAPSGPPGLQSTAVDILLKAGSWALVVGVTVGCLTHAIGLGARRAQTA
jgi:hypothetical protein